MGHACIECAIGSAGLLAAGNPDAAWRAASAEAGPLDQLGRAQAELLRARIAFTSGADDAARRLFHVAKRLEPLDIDLARDAYLDALGATMLVSATARCDPTEVARSALIVRPAGTSRLTDLLLDGIARQLTEGLTAAAPTLCRAVTALVDDESSTLVGLAGGWLASHVAGLLLQHDLQRKLAHRHVRVVRGAGAVAVLPQILTQLVEIHLREGKLVVADGLMRELEAAGDTALSEATVQAAVLIAAYRGREEEGQRLMAEARIRRCASVRRFGAFAVEFADLLLNNGLGRYKDGLRSGRRVLQHLEAAGQAPWVLPELVEAAARAGAADDAAAALRRLAESARISGTEWALGLEARCRALLSSGSAAEQRYLEAVARLHGTSCRVDLARAHLLYGEWLRRAGRRVDARQHLRTAQDLFSDMDIEAFGERARRELRATGETVRKRVVETRDDLTPQEQEIARLARDGLSNPEIGGRLFLSRRTVEWHLRKIFVKLGITSRFSLCDALPGSIGMEACADRARNEQITGDEVRRRPVEVRDDLTAQERQIARLARDGLSNPEIGARLFLSPRTVEWHLRKVFMKLDIHSRWQLSDALSSSDAELVPANSGLRQGRLLEIGSCAPDRVAV
jgi:DNA-binding NarL/FixJ family response regulator